MLITWQQDVVDLYMTSAVKSVQFKLGSLTSSI